jgi:hypothetical protein
MRPAQVVRKKISFIDFFTPCFAVYFQLLSLLPFLPKCPSVKDKNLLFGAAAAQMNLI